MSRVPTDRDHRFLPALCTIKYRVRPQDCPQEMERNEAAARHSWARQHDWLLLRFFPFPVGHPEAAPGRAWVLHTHVPGQESEIDGEAQCHLTKVIS